MRPHLGHILYRSECYLTYFLTLSSAAFSNRCSPRISSISNMLTKALQSIFAHLIVFSQLLTSFLIQPGRQILQKECQQLIKMQGEVSLPMHSWQSPLMGLLKPSIYFFRSRQMPGRVVTLTNFLLNKISYSNLSFFLLVVSLNLSRIYLTELRFFPLQLIQLLTY